MKVSIRGKNFRVFAELQEAIQARLQFALGRFAPRIEDVAVSLADVNGPRGGLDKQCRVVARLRPRGKLTILEVGTDFLAAAASAADRLGRAAARALERRREARINRQGMSPRRWPTENQHEQEGSA